MTKFKRIMSVLITGSLLLSFSAGTTATANAIDYNDISSTNSISNEVNKHLAMKNIASAQQKGFEHFRLSNETVATANTTDYNDTSSTNSISNEVNKYLDVESGASAQEKDFEYTKLSNDTVVIDGYSGNESNVTIPSYIDGYKVTDLASSIFETNENLKTLTIPSTISNIRDINHFSTYNTLESITVEASNATYSSAGGVLFNKNKTELLLCPSGNKTTSYTVPNSVTTICHRAFDDCKNLKTVSIPSSVTKIDTGVFSDCTALNTVKLSEGLITISDLAFYNCKSLKEITIPDSVIDIGDRALGVYHTSDFKEYIVEDFTIRGYLGSYTYFYFLADVKVGLINFIDLGKSQYYLEFYYDFNEDNKTIEIFYYLGDNKNVVIPSTIDGYTVTRIELGAFFDNNNITSVTVPNTVTSIGHSAFAECDNLESVSLSEGLKTIGDNYDPLEDNVYAAFEQCPKLKSITIPASVTNMTYSGLGYYACGSKIDGFTIKGYKGTAGQSYAVDNGFKFTALNTTSPESVKLNKTSLTLGVGESYTLNSTITPSNAITTYSWSSSNKDVATVSSNGNITAKKSGTATITVKTSNGKTATCKITVKNAPSKISLNKTAITLGVGETFDLNSSLPSGTASYSVKYSSNNTAVATVNSSGGLVTAKKVGTATITATTYNGKKVTCTVTVKNAPSKISLNKTAITLGVGETFDLNSSLPSGTASYSVKYSSNNTAIATVNEAGGLVTAKKIGTATIIATTYNGKKVTCTVTVKDAPSKISLNKTAVTLGVGETFDLNSSLPSGTASYSVKYSSNSTAIATVNSSGGLVTAKNIGTATITATTYNGKTATCTVTVKKPPSKISLNRSTITLGIGELFDLNSFLPNGTASYNIKFSSNNTAVADVNAIGGVITTKKVGTAVITATTHNGKKATCTITVKNAPSSVLINQEEVTLGVGEVFYITSSLPSDTASFNIKYASRNTNIATVTSLGGVVTAKGVGTVNITAITHNGKTTSCKVTVKNAPDKITLNETALTLKVGETFDLNSSLPADTASYSIKYTSRNSKVATVNSTNGLVTAKGVGTATITAITHNGKTATCKVTVE